MWPGLSVADAERSPVSIELWVASLSLSADFTRFIFKRAGSGKFQLYSAIIPPRYPVRQRLDKGRFVCDLLPHIPVRRRHVRRFTLCILYFFNFWQKKGKSRARGSFLLPIMARQFRRRRPNSRRVCAHCSSYYIICFCAPLCAACAVGSFSNTPLSSFAPQKRTG